MLTSIPAGYLEKDTRVEKHHDFVPGTQKQDVYCFASKSKSPHSAEDVCWLLERG